MSINNEQRQEEENNKNKDNDACDGANLVGIGREGSAGSAQAVQVSDDDNTSLITPCPLPSWATVTGAGDVVTGGIIQTVTYLATAIAICSCRALLFTVPAHESRAAGALPGDVVAVGSVLTLAYQRTVLAIKPQRASLSAVEPRPARSAFTFAIVGTAEGSIVAVASVDAVWAPVRRWAGLGAVTADPTRVALTRSVNGVTGAIVGASANSCTVFPKSATGTHFIAEATCEARQTVT